MAKNVTAAKVISVAKKYIGTKESPANSNNVIFNTHYYGKPVRGAAYPWCAAFLWDVFRLAGASDLFYGGKKSAYCPSIMQYAKAHKQWHSTPKVGDLALFDFKGNGIACHIGIVVDVISKTSVKTIEGNTAIGNDSNGGEVMYRRRSTSTILGYYRPDYASTSSKPVAKKDDKKPTTTTKKDDTKKPSTTTKKDEPKKKPTTTKKTTYTQTQFIKDVERALGVKADGKGDKTLLSKTPTLSVTTNRKHKVVKYVQKYLISLGISCGSCGADGDFGNGTAEAVKKYQKKYVKMANPDGVITSGCGTWKKLLKMK